MNFSTKKILLGAVIFFSLVTAQTVFAKKTYADAPSALSDVVGKSGIEESDISSAAGAVVKGIIGAMGLLFFILMVYAGMVWMLARGDDARVTKARETIIAATIGLIIIVAAYAITSLVVDRIVLKNTGTGEENTPEEEKPNTLGGNILACCVTPSSKTDWIDVSQPMMSTLSKSQCNVLAKEKVGDNYQSEEGTLWDFYPEITDTGTCSKILGCWQKVGLDAEESCLGEILSDQNLQDKLDQKAFESWYCVNEKAECVTVDTGATCNEDIGYFKTLEACENDTGIDNPNI